MTIEKFNMKVYLVQTIGVLVRGVMLFLVLKFSATTFDGTEMIALLAFLGGDTVISIIKAAIRTTKRNIVS